MVAKDRQKSPGSAKAEVGEIDTRAPFQSVKDAVNLFGEGAFSGEKPAIRKPKPHSAERVLAKETQLHLVQKELNKLKEQLKNAETTKSQVLVELEKAKRTMEELTQKLNAVTESKEQAIKQTESAKILAMQFEEANSDGFTGTNDSWKQDLEKARGQYTSLITELDTAKQELRKMQQDCDATTETRVAALKQAEEAELAAKANIEKVGELSKEISAIQETLGQVKLATLHAQQEQAKIFTEKDVQRKACKATLEESAKQLLTLKKEFDPEMIQNLEAQLAETGEQIGSLKKQMESVKASDLESVRTVTLELDDAKGSLKKVAEEESSLQSLVESLKVELENVKKEHSELKEKEAETEAIVGNLHVKLRKSKSELEACLTEESKARGASDEMIATLQLLVLETENARKEAEEMKDKAEELKKEAEATKTALKEAEQRLRVALEEAEEAKMAEVNALDEIKNLSERTTAARASTSESGAKITISKDEFDSLSRKVEESEKLAEMKVAAALAQVEAVKASENEALKRLEATKKEIEDMKAETEAALKRAQMAEAAKRAVEGELRKWREREQKKAAETASRILAETDVSSDSSPPIYKVQKYQYQPGKAAERRLEKVKTSVSKKVLRSNFSGIFSRKKNQIEGGSPSYLPGEKPV
ncbi:WEB family protein At5g55860 [Punica granatum]|uniref:WEB family protein At5g55860 n=1 Tax=Punica granatum TaxID=22663 RepID=A0A6P8EA79_PUNGR|nr:WEB family protein At5g55860 [Punica granatum]XP_031403449.1 WEB family protein At5g55860 [Punica granatum]